MERSTTAVNLLRNCCYPWGSNGDSHEFPVNHCSMVERVLRCGCTTETQKKAFTSCLTVTCAPELRPDRGCWLQDVWFMLIPRLPRPGFRVMWEWRQQPAGMQLRVLAQILNLALVLVLEWIWVLVQVGVGRQNMKTDVDGRREGGGTDWPEWMTGRRGGQWMLYNYHPAVGFFVPAEVWCNCLFGKIQLLFHASLLVLEREEPKPPDVLFYLRWGLAY